MNQPPMRRTRPAWRVHCARLALLLLLCTAALQVVFAVRIALMAVLAPQSTTFQRSEAWRLLVEQQRLPWRQGWVDRAQLAPSLQRAVIASEDAGFVEHGGIEWAAVDKAWSKNERALARAERQQQRRPDKPVAIRIVGGSTITQQLAKNLFLSGERTALRKAQELLLALLLEALLSKHRILEIYLNNVEWGQGVFGADAAAQHYFRLPAARLSPLQAAQLAVMLPAPKRFEKRAGSAYVADRAATIAARMGTVALP